MKKLFYSLGLLLLGCFSAQCQVSTYVAAGVNVSNVDTRIPEHVLLFFKSKPYSQLFLTIGASAPISEKLHFFGELSYSPNGYKSVSFTGENISTVKYHHINLQPGVSIELNPIKFEFGAFIGTSLSDKIKQTNGEWSGDLDLTETLNLGAFAGVNISLVESIGVFARYYRGFSRLTDFNVTDMNGTLAGRLNERVSNIQIGVSVYLF